MTPRYKHLEAMSNQEIHIHVHVYGLGVASTTAAPSASAEMALTSASASAPASTFAPAAAPTSTLAPASVATSAPAMAPASASAPPTAARQSLALALLSTASAGKKPKQKPQKKPNPGDVADIPEITCADSPVSPGLLGLSADEVWKRYRLGRAGEVGRNDALTVTPSTSSTSPDRQALANEVLHVTPPNESKKRPHDGAPEPEEEM